MKKIFVLCMIICLFGFSCVLGTNDFADENSTEQGEYVEGEGGCESALVLYYWYIHKFYEIKVKADLYSDIKAYDALKSINDFAFCKIFKKIMKYAIYS